MTRAWSKWARRGLVVLVLVAAGIAAAAYWQQREAEARAAADAAIRQEVVGRGPIVSTVSATGNLAPEKQVSLYFPAGALQPVAAVNVSVGQQVAAGAVLALLDDRDLAMAVWEAELALKSAELDLAQILAPPRPEDIALAEANLRVARSQVYAASLGPAPQETEIARLSLLMAQTALNNTYATMARLEEEGRWSEKNALQAQADRQVEDARVAELRYQAALRAAPQGQLAAAQAAVEQTEAVLARLERGPSAEDVRIAEVRVSQARTALELAQHSLNNARLVAPFDGVVAAVNARKGEPTLAALPAIVLADTRQYHLDVLVDEVDIALVEAGQAVTVTLDAAPDVPLAGAVEWISPAATVNAGIVSYAVRLVLPSGGAAMRGGMTATAAIVVDEASDAVRVPNWAIRRDRDTGQAWVGVLRNGQIVDVPVTLGLRDELYSEVLNGIIPGEIVAVDTTRDQFRLFGGS
jgi:HlyD family secretion protein